MSVMACVRFNYTILQAQNCQCCTYSSRLHNNYFFDIIVEQIKTNIAALNISTGPAHFSDRRASTGQYIAEFASFTGPAGPPS